MKRKKIGEFKTEKKLPLHKSQMKIFQINELINWLVLFSRRKHSGYSEFLNISVLNCETTDIYNQLMKRINLQKNAFN